MNLGFWQLADRTARSLTPFALAFALVILGIVPLHLPGFTPVAPILVLVAVYHWGLYRPALLPPIAVFFIGLLQDMLGGAPPGLHAIVFLTVFGLVATQRRFLVGKSFLTYWFGFGLLAAAAAVEMWILGSVWNLAILDFRALLFQFLLTLGLFPPVAWIFLRWQQTFLQQE